ncbi:MAG TPA: hypothetical protein VMV77_08870 [Bacteroidales bacterium]|nr:hypothetical protein [Bacteroidales bacterium]
MGPVAVLGLGPSLSLFNPSEYTWSIGVNDIWKYHQTDVIVCLDRISIFKGERLVTIENSKPKVFYSQVANWSCMPGFQKLDLTTYYPEHEVKLEIPQIYKSYCSPFVACQVAYKHYRATEIHVYGVDLVDHPNLTAKICDKIKIHFKNLAVALEREGCKLVVFGDGILKDITN